MKHLMTVIFTALLIFTLAPGHGEAAQYHNSDANIKFDMADSWKVRSASPLILSSPKGDVVLVFEVIKAENLVAALDGSEAIMLQHMSNIQSQPAEKIDVNGIPGARITGQAKIDQVPVEFLLSVIEGRKKVFTYLFYFGTPDSHIDNAEDLKNFRDSVSKMR